MAFMYALGVGYEANQAKANLYWSFAALGGSVLGNLALGYRYAKGLRKVFLNLLLVLLPDWLF